jgi:hypothetical protein
MTSRELFCIRGICDFNCGHYDWECEVHKFVQYLDKYRIVS